MIQPLPRVFPSHSHVCSISTKHTHKWSSYKSQAGLSSLSRLYTADFKPTTTSHSNFPLFPSRSLYISNHPHNRQRAETHTGVTSELVTLVGPRRRPRRRPERTATRQEPPLEDLRSIKVAGSIRRNLRTLASTIGNRFIFGNHVRPLGFPNPCSCVISRKSYTQPMLLDKTMKKSS
ncbi:hypothetical protein HanIR_Chr10g0489361 [Helianthus annuus]|nr:hypothetical protein HanIR_Chr10g0489361 [Helianthus annuus]